MSLWTRPSVQSGLLCRVFGAGLVRPLAMFSTGRPATNATTTNATTDPSSKQRHGLWDFFENGQALPKEPTYTGRAWRAAELRHKSFDDLHKLWYVLLKERNLLSSQWAEAKRYGITPQQFTTFGREVKCRKSMARILTVLRERQLAYERAIKRHRRERFVARRAAEYKAMREARAKAQPQQEQQAVQSEASSTA
ncbi:mitochondrial 39-S ribosomal protein L47 (MRP-L47)-domain-containing protein [Syncephalis pseudoplumigaleata]|uniref:Large ribosomal subunit protein uL29m n=1 Tax=Syncephalis pseudoplumigaleata TaxID=1712513 RepID=A0A4P9YT86_9FUNG|nr:mitochondrial 39-S ribosomal protein L47 (MRP-L47)-domain-containing protein [Syncephalis pseudoplumigaleata]|eukprot:RKP23126.1 mitochondrial 39-S ribosomal protein L47 (MRP-L47)-domain-containing protein [Syncephalis pseudoplumigaleata]